jgi:threonine/homoserine/homoserine lactone efflux protein
VPPESASLLAFWAAFTLALVSPGPNFALLLKIGLGSGRQAALRTVLGIAVGEAAWGFAAVFGVAALALRYPTVGTAIRWGGGAFLLWLALGALRSAWRGHGAAASAEPAPASGGFATGLAIMLLNPKAGVFWVSLTGVLLGPGIGPATGLLVVAVAVLISLAWHTTLALAFSGTTAVRLYARARRGIEAALGTALAALGVKLLAAT